MTDKSKQRASARAARTGLTHQAALNENRRRIQAVVNASERRVEEKLQGAAAENGARLYPKLRFADVVRIERSGISDEEYSFAMKSHLDFVVTDAERMPLFAVEFDGGGHDPARDALKNRLCDHFALPLARIDHRHLAIEARGLNAVSWLTDVFFMNMWMEEACEAGTLAAEDVDPFNVLSWEKSPLKWPLSFTAGTSLKLHQSQKEGRVRKGHTRFHAAFSSGDGRAAGVTAFRVTDDRFLFGGASIYLNNFGVSSAEVALELATARLHGQLDLFLAGDIEGMDATTTYERMSALVAGKSFRMGGGSVSDPEDFRLIHSSDDLFGGPKTRIVPPRGVGRH